MALDCVWGQWQLVCDVEVDLTAEAVYKAPAEVAVGASAGMGLASGFVSVEVRLLVHGARQSIPSVPSASIPAASIPSTGECFRGV